MHKPLDGSLEGIRVVQHGRATLCLHLKCAHLCCILPHHWVVACQIIMLGLCACTTPNLSKELTDKSRKRRPDGAWVVVQETEGNHAKDMIFFAFVPSDKAVSVDTNTGSVLLVVAWRKPGALQFRCWAHLDIGQSDELRLCDGLISLAEHALLEEDLGLVLARLDRLEVCQYVRDVLVVVHDVVLIRQLSAQLNRLHHLAFMGRTLSRFCN